MPTFNLRARIYSDGRTKDCKQSWFSWVIAIITMTIYTGTACHGTLVCSWWEGAAPGTACGGASTL